MWVVYQVYEYAQAHPAEQEAVRAPLDEEDDDKEKKQNKKKKKTGCVTVRCCA